MNGLFLQGTIFSVIAIGGMAFAAWWLYFSPMRQAAVTGKSGGQEANGVEPASMRLSNTLALLVGIGAILTCFGAYWDLSEHVITGIVPGGEDFLWPPHLMIYAGFLLSFVVAVSGLVALAVPNMGAGVLDPRSWVRQNPYVGAIVIAAGYGIFSIPGDAIWHELYGLDLTAWSPPHVFLAITSASLPVLAAGLLKEGAPNSAASGNVVEERERNKNAANQRGIFNSATWDRALERISASGWRNIVKLLYFVLALNMLLVIGSVEWEVGQVEGLIAQRPIWLYPVVIGVCAFFLSIVARRIVPGPWTATIFALFFFGIRIAVSAFADTVSGAPPRLTLVFILGAILLDLTFQWMSRIGFKPSDWQFRLAAAGGFMVGFSIIAQPTIAFYLVRFFPAFPISAHLFTVLILFILSAVIYPVALSLGDWLRASVSVPPVSFVEEPEAIAAAAGG